LYKEPGASIKASANVCQTLEAALWAFSKSESFEQGLLLAVNLGGDTDTVNIRPVCISYILSGWCCLWANSWRILWTWSFTHTMGDKDNTTRKNSSVCR
jgi:hypothetical protein